MRVCSGVFPSLLSFYDLSWFLSSHPISHQWEDPCTMMSEAQHPSNTQVVMSIFSYKLINIVRKRIINIPPSGALVLWKLHMPQISLASH